MPSGVINQSIMMLLKVEIDDDNYYYDQVDHNNPDDNHVLLLFLLGLCFLLLLRSRAYSFVHIQFICPIVDSTTGNPNMTFRNKLESSIYCKRLMLSWQTGTMTNL